MNGRIYDPLLGRFLSADLVVQAPGSLQSYNRYSYVMNNPLTLTDPTGFISEKQRKREEEQAAQNERLKRIEEAKVKATQRTEITNPGGTSVVINPVVKVAPVYVSSFSRKDAPKGAHAITFAEVSIKRSAETFKVDNDRYNRNFSKSVEITVTIKVEVLEKHKGDQGIMKLEQQHVDDLTVYAGSGLAKDMQDPNNFLMGVSGGKLNASPAVAYNDPEKFVAQASERSGDFWDRSAPIAGVRDRDVPNGPYHRYNEGMKMNGISVDSASPTPSASELAKHQAALSQGNSGYFPNTQTP
jgi:hypothetical protein